MIFLLEKNHRKLYFDKNDMNTYVCDSQASDNDSNDRMGYGCPGTCLENTQKICSFFDL